MHAQKYFPGPRYEDRNVLYTVGEYDWVVSLETIEHIPWPESVLGAFLRAAPNLVVSTPNQERYPFNPASYKGDEYPHLRHYTPKEFDELLNKAGWKVVSRHRQINKQDPVTEGTDGKFMVYVCKR